MTELVAVSMMFRVRLLTVFVPSWACVQMSVVGVMQ